jgi:hypothetical protein
MDKLSFYKYATWGLLLLNISILVFFIVIVGPPPGGPGGGGPKGAAHEILSLDNTQWNQFETSVKEHSARLNQINNEQKVLLQPLFMSIATKNIELKKDSLMNQIAQLEVQKIKSAYQHLEEIKVSLKKDQEAKFGTFVQTILGKVLAPA